MSDQQNNVNEKKALNIKLADSQSGGEQLIQKFTGAISGAQSSAGGGKPFVNKLQDLKKKSN